MVSGLECCNHSFSFCRGFLQLESCLETMMRVYSQVVEPRFPKRNEDLYSAERYLATVTYKRAA